MVSTATLKAVRTGRHACFDRVVFDLSSKPTAYSAHYTSNVFRAGAGHLVPLRGGAKLEIMLGYRTFRQISYAGSTEGAAWVGLGVRARLPFRVFTLAGPGSGSRIVIDVAHSW